MHLIATIPGGWNPNDDGIFHIAQSPGDILFLSAADTELCAMNSAYGKYYQKNTSIPSLRLANLIYFKQEFTIDTYIEEVVSHAKVVVLKLLGGVAYFSYLCEALLECAKEKDIQILFLPGDTKPDLELMSMSTIDLQTVDRIWKLLLAGGMNNTTSVLEAMIGLIRTPSIAIPHPEIPAETFFINREGQMMERLSTPIESSWVLIFSYKSYYQSDNLEPLMHLMEVLDTQGLASFTFFAQSYRDIVLEQQLSDCFMGQHPNVIINTTGFSIQSFKNHKKGIFDHFNVPVIQAIIANCNQQSWRAGLFGLTPTDIAMQVSLPEVDGKIITSIISFKESAGKDPYTDSDIVRYVPHPEGIQSVVTHAYRWIMLQKLKNEDKKLAIILPNYPSKNSRLANGVGLDTPASTINILHALDEQNYNLGKEIPEDTDTLIHLITRNITNDLDTLHTKKASIFLDAEVFFEYYHTLSTTLRNKIELQWGHPKDAPNFKNNTFLIPGVKLGNVFLSIQPSRGYNLDIEASYHAPDLPPTYTYLAYYAWMHQVFGAHAVIHVGKHGNLEWLPGKSLALNKESCFPAAIIEPIPHFYPFIVNDPGEGTQAKRRTHAVILDHMIPPMTRAENHGELLKLELLIDEYYEAALVDHKRSKLLKSKIEALVKSTHLEQDLNTNSDDIDALMEAIDGYLCELKEAQIRGGLHILGTINQEKLADQIVALHRLPQLGVMGLTQALASDLQVDFDPLNVDYAAIYNKEIEGISCRTYGQAVEVLEIKALTWVRLLLSHKTIPSEEVAAATQSVLTCIKCTTLPLIERTEEEIKNLIDGLDGKYVPPGGSGAPTRGRMDILPTGRNFYSVDVRTIPSESAYELGVKSADNLVQRYLQDHGEYPTSIGISVWGTSTMRTGGDDIAQAFALMGIRPIWEGINRRVKDFEVCSLMELKRPRIDVILRISGFFRDAFPDIISLFNAAVAKVAALDEPLDQNPIRARYLKEREDWEGKGLKQQQAHERALYRVFGAKPGAYGAGLQGLIDEKNWHTQEDLAKAYINWSGYAYFGDQNEGHSAHESFQQRLKTMEIVLQNQDNREHDLLDSDDYYQFQGGLTAAVTKERGEQPLTYFGDHSRPEHPRIKSLKEELLKVYRSRVINPKWIAGMQDHGYKGAFEMAATMDYLFAYDATTNLIDDFMYEGITEAYLLNKENQEFIRKKNPWALKDMSERMLEAIQRGLWENPNEYHVEALQSLYLNTENLLEE